MLPGEKVGRHNQQVSSTCAKMHIVLFVAFSVSTTLSVFWKLNLHLIPYLCESIWNMVDLLLKSSLCPAGTPMGNQLLVRCGLCFVEASFDFTGIQVSKKLTSARHMKWQWVFHIQKMICHHHSSCTNYEYWVWNGLLSSSRRIKVVALRKLWTWRSFPSPRACTMTVLTSVLKWRNMAQVCWLNAGYCSWSNQH